jgi:hexosaminidase
MESQLPRLDVRDVKYSRSAYQPLAELQVIGNERRIVLRTEIPGIDLYYTFDGSNPDTNYPRYNGPLTIPPGADQLRIAPYRRGERIGEQLNLTITEMEKRRELKLRRAEREGERILKESVPKQ